MVKIRPRLLLFGIVIFALLINTAYASTSNHLIFSKVDVRVGGRTSNSLVDGETIGEQAKPGDTVEFRVKMQNNYTSADNLKIRDITVRTTLEAIDNGDDLEEESNSFSLSPGSTKLVTLKFEVPLEVDEDTFDALIHAEGDDQNGTSQESDMTLRLEVNKKSHLLKITRNTLSPAEVTCNRKNVQLAATVINIGNEDEDDVTVQVTSPDFGVDMKDSITSLQATPNEPESTFSKMYSFNVPNELAAGSYPITLRALYDNNLKTAEGTATLTVNDCSTAKQEISKTTTIKEQPQVETAAPPVTGAATTSNAEQTSSQDESAVVTEESFFKSNAFIAGIIIVEVIVVIVGVILVASLFRRK